MCAKVETDATLKYTVEDEWRVPIDSQKPQRTLGFFSSKDDFCLEMLESVASGRPTPYHMFPVWSGGIFPKKTEEDHEFYKFPSLGFSSILLQCCICTLLPSMCIKVKTDATLLYMVGDEWRVLFS
jgi:hypothetical protein